jgi:uncharacterized protein (DUF1330 family)
MILVATLVVKPGAVERFREFESKAARVMEKHGGRIERAITLHPHPDDDFFREVHVVWFPDEAALEAYRDDPDFIALAPLRESCIAATEIRYGETGPDYHKE